MAMAHNNEAMSVGIGGGQATVGMEGYLLEKAQSKEEEEITMDDGTKVRLKKLDGNGKEFELTWPGFLSDWKQQDARTSFANAFKLIKKLQAEGYLPPNSGAVLYIKSDGCPAQYKCAVALYLVGLLAKAFGIQIDYMVTAAHHGKSLVDAIAGKDKYEIGNALIQ